MTAEATVLAGRAAAEQVMVDACQVVRPGGPDVFDDVTLQYVPADRVVLYAGRCRVQGLTLTTVDSGDRLVYEQARVVSVPMSVVDVAVGDMVLVTACELDPALVGRVLVVRSVATKTFLTARRLQCEEVAG